jgi:hypothetical protein
MAGEQDTVATMDLTATQYVILSEYVCHVWSSALPPAALPGCSQLSWEDGPYLLLLLLLSRRPVYRNQRKKAALAFTKDAYSKLQAENQALLQQLEESNRESYQVSEQFRQELLGKNQKIAELQLQLDQVRTHGKAVRAIVSCSWLQAQSKPCRQGVAHEPGCAPKAATPRSSHACQHNALLPRTNTGPSPEQ